MGYEQTLLLHELLIPAILYSTFERLPNKVHEINLFPFNILIPIAYIILQSHIQSVHKEEKFRMKRSIVFRLPRILTM
jgi:hypothetical protein